MQMKKVVKNVVALGSAAMLMGSTVLGATMDLSNYPEPFVKDGEFNGNLVVGADAATADVIGAVDIASALQAANVEEQSVEVDGDVSASYSVEGGVSLKKDNNALSPFESVFSSKSKLDGEDDSEILGRDEIVEEDDNEDYKFDQEISFDPTGGDQYEVLYGRPDTNEFDDPVIYLDTEAPGKAGEDLWEYSLEFDSTVDITEFTDSEEIEFFGKTYTIDPNNDDDLDTLKLYGGSDSVSLLVGDEQTVDGVDVELIGANTDSSPATVTVNVDGKLYSKEEGQTITAGDTQIYIKSVHVQTIPEKSAVAELSVGSEDLELDFDGGELSLDGDKVDGYSVSLEGTNITNMDGFSINYNPYDSDDEVEYLEAGDSIVDEVFDYELRFDGLDTEFDSDRKSRISFDKSGDVMSMSFTNAEGDDITFDYAEETSDDANVELYDDLALSQNYVEDENYFFLSESINGESDLTSFFKASDVSEDDGVVYVELSNEAKGTSSELRNGKEILDTGVYAYGTDSSITMHSDVSGSIDDVSRDTVFLTGKEGNEVNSDTSGLVFDEDDGTSAETSFVWMNEDGDALAFNVKEVETNTTLEITSAGDTFYSTAFSASSDNLTITSGLNVHGDDDSGGENVSFSIEYTEGELYEVDGLKNTDTVLNTEFGGQITLDDSVGTDLTVTFAEDADQNYLDDFDSGSLVSNFDVVIKNTGDNEPEVESVSGITGIADDDGDYKYGLSAYGTYYKLDTDDDQEDLDIYYPAVEQNVVAGVGKDLEIDMSGAGSSEVTTQKINKIDAGMAVLDTEIDVAGKNIISVGGPSANDVSAELLGEYAGPEGFGEGQAFVKLVENGDKVAMVVAGWSADDTRKASRVLANYDDYDMSGEEVLVSGTSMSDIEVSAVE